MLQEQPKENEAPQVSGSSPWHAQVRLKDKKTQLLAAGGSPCGALAVAISILPVLQGISGVDNLPPVNNGEMQEGDIHIITEEFIRVNNFMDTKQSLWGVLHLCEKHGFAWVKVCLCGALLGTDIHSASWAYADRPAGMWEPSVRG